MEESSTIQPPDRHSFPCYHCHGEGEVLQCGRPCEWGSVNEISCCGCYIKTIHPLPVGAQVQLRLTIADTGLDLWAKVASIDAILGTRMNFDPVPPDQWNNLAQIVERVSAIDSSSSLF